ncbi:MAG: AAA family ATPase [Saprospiraceae bacterium]|nr:AAA family ATPase [Candidatus Opimibacter iunctus]
MLPVILLAFANDKQNTGAGYLRGLTLERNAIRDALMKAEENGLCHVIVEPDATVDRLFDIFQNPLYRDRIAIFHYGGHAESYSLLLESASGGKATAHSEGLVAFLSKQKSLRLVFLNGCSSQKQSQELVAAGLPAVIGTSQSINDSIATGLATRFYKGVAAGMTIERAWTDSVDQTKTEYKTSDTASLFVEGILGAPGESTFPWELYTGEGGASSKAWNLPEAANQPLFGLELPRTYYRKLPLVPYPGLQSFARDDAAVFFGRGTDIRKMYTQLGHEQPVLLISGKKGVGKSSLLAAGLAPRLEDAYVVSCAKVENRNVIEVLSEALDQARVEAGLDTRSTNDVSGAEQKIAELQKSIAANTGVAKEILERELDRLVRLTALERLTYHEQWIAIEEKTGKPLVVILDELPPDPEQWKSLHEVMTGIFEGKKTSRGKLLLSIDEDILGPFRSMLQSAGFPYAEIFIQPLTWDGLIEAITGITLSPVTRDYYRLQIESTSANNLPITLAGDLSDGDVSLVAPYLQVILSSLWNIAIKENAQLPLFTLRGYQQGMMTGEIMEGYYAQQLTQLKSWNEGAVASGLALDLLYMHTSALGKSNVLDTSTRKQTYGERGEMVNALIKKCKALFLLSSAPSDSTALGHNLLAQVVIRHYSISLSPGQQAARILNARINDAADTSKTAWLNEADLEAVEQGIPGMRSLTNDERELLEFSRAKKIQAHKDRQRNRIIRITLVSVVAVFAALAGWQWYVANQRYLYSRSGELAFTAREILAEDNTIALDVAHQAYSMLSEDSPPLVMQTLSDIFHAQDERALYSANFPHAERVFTAVFSPDGQYVLTASEDGYTKLWDLKGKELMAFPHEIEVTAAAFSPNGNQILTITRTHVHLWERDGKLTDKDSIPETVTNLADFSTDGMKIIPAPVATETTKDALSSDQLNAVFSNDRKQMITISPDGASSLIKVWNANGDSLYSFRCRGTEVKAVFSPDGLAILTASNDYTAKLWDFSHPYLHRFPRQSQAMNTVDYFPEGNTYVTTSFDSTARIWDGSGHLIDSLRHGDVVMSAWYAPDGKYILTASRDSTARLWDPKASKAVILQHGNEVTTAVFSHDGASVLTASLDSKVRLWDTQGKLIHTYTSAGDVSMACFSPDDSRILSVGASNVVTLWDVKGDSISSKTYLAKIYSASFSPDGTKTIISRADSLVDVLSSAGETIISLRHFEKPKIAFFTADGQHIITGGGKTVKIWDENRVLLDSLIHNENVTSVSVSPDGREILTTSIDHHAYLWHFDGDLIAEYVSHTAKINFGCFVKDGTHVLTASDDGYVMRWRTPRAIYEGLNVEPVYQLTRKEMEEYGIK